MGGIGLRFAVLTLLLAALPLGAARAELEISAYAGGSISFDSDVTVKEGGTSTTYKDVSWDSATFEMPLHYGFRGTWWFDSHPNWGVAVDFTHAKVKADPRPAGYERLEFTHGLNTLTANVLYRHPTSTRFTPYGGLGLGVALPHVEVKNANGDTGDYQFTGLAAQGLAGVDFRIWQGLSLFVEYKLMYTSNDADLTGGGSLETDIVTNFFGLGVSYKFDFN